MHILYCSLFLPYLTYCIEIWGNTYPTNINGIVLLHKMYSHYVWDQAFGSHKSTFLTFACLEISRYY